VNFFETSVEVLDCAVVSHYRVAHTPATERRVEFCDALICLVLASLELLHLLAEVGVGIDDFSL
jgi:hypothetical protein